MKLATTEACAQIKQFIFYLMTGLKTNSLVKIMFINSKIYHFKMIFILHFLCVYLTMLTLYGCNLISRNIPSDNTQKNGDVTLLWNEFPGATAYNVYVSKAPGVTKLSGYKISNVTNPFRIYQLESGKTYYFVVTVVNGTEESKESKELSYFSVADKIGLIYWEKLFDKSIQDHKPNTVETRQTMIPAPEKTITEPERAPLENETLPDKIAVDETPSINLAKDNIQPPKEMVDETEIQNHNSNPAEKRQEKKVTPERKIRESDIAFKETKTVHDKVPGDAESSDEFSKINFQSSKEIVAVTADIGDDFNENLKAATAPIETDNDQSLMITEDMRLKAARMLSDSHFYIFFEQDSNELSPKAIEKLERIYEILTNDSEVKLKLNGYSDSSDTASVNQMVSDVRANSVKSYLSGRGITPSRMMALGHGAKKLLANNKSEEGRRLNQRVEIELIIP